MVFGRGMVDVSVGGSSGVRLRVFESHIRCSVVRFVHFEFVWQVINGKICGVSRPFAALEMLWFVKDHAPIKLGDRCYKLPLIGARSLPLGC